MVSWLLTLVATDLRGASARAFGVHRFRIGVRLRQCVYSFCWTGRAEAIAGPVTPVQLVNSKQIFTSGWGLPLRYAGQTSRPCRRGGQNKKPGVAGFFIADSTVLRE
jgi:hypothetical protein